MALSIGDMQAALQEKYKDRWEPVCSATGQNKLLWMLGYGISVAELQQAYEAKFARNMERW